MKILAFANQKGGVGKTTTVINVGAGLAEQGHRVLLIDLDPQAHLTNGLGLTPEDADYSILEVFSGNATIAQAALKRGNFDVIVSCEAMADADVQFNSQLGREYLLRNALAGVENYDYVLLDCPPSLGVITVNGFTAAQEVMVPLQVHYLALNALGQLLQIVELVRKRLNPQLKVAGIIPTMYNASKNLNRDVVQVLRENFDSLAFETVIRDSVKLAEAPSHGKTIYEYASASNGANDYRQLVQELLKRQGGAA